MPIGIHMCLCIHRLYFFTLAKFVHWTDTNILEKTLISVTPIGWNFGSAGFSQMVSNPCDGLDSGWEYSANRGSPRGDKRIKYFISADIKQEMRAAFENEAKRSNKARFLMSAAVSAGKDTIDSAYQIPELGQRATPDMINVMTHDFHILWGPVTKHPQKRQYISNSFFPNFAMNYWESQEARAEKLIVGFPTYGNIHTSEPSAGELAYPKICGFLKDGGNQWVGCDNIKSFQIKVDWLMKSKFGENEKKKNSLINVLQKAKYNPLPATSSGGSSSSGDTNSMDCRFNPGKANGCRTNKNQIYSCSGEKSYYKRWTADLDFDSSCFCHSWP
uniref:GH18 domain-containing protein n=1 Tax=Stegastes partitus TaxID=144197 RepID=A0A3B5BD42_9TELE